MGNIYKDNKENITALFTYNNDTETITKTDIYGVLELSAINHGFDNLQDLKDNKKCSSMNFNIILQDIGTFFKSCRALVVTSPRDGVTWEYDKTKLLILTDIYINICYEYNKMCSIDGFLYFCGIGNSSYFNYQEKSVNLSDNLRAQIAERLREKDNLIQKMRARDSEQPILQLAYNNYEHGWNGEIKRNEIKSTIKTLDDIKNERLTMSPDGGQNDI